MSNFGQIVATAAGAVVGFLVAGPVGAVYGMNIGLLAGSYLFPTELPGREGPRLEDFEQLHADPGSPVHVVFGTAAVPGFRMYLGPVREVATTETVGGGKQEQEVTTFTYFQTIAIGLCEGPIKGVTRIWENGKLVYDSRPQQDGESNEDYQARAQMTFDYAETFELYTGSEDQLPDPTLELERGVGAVPAFRGLAYIVFPERQFRDDQGRRHPVFKVEVSAEPGVLPPIYLEDHTITAVQQDRPGSFQVVLWGGGNFSGKLEVIIGSNDGDNAPDFIVDGKRRTLADNPRGIHGQIVQGHSGGSDLPVGHAFGIYAFEGADGDGTPFSSREWLNNKGEVEGSLELPYPVQARLTVVSGDTPSANVPLNTWVPLVTVDQDPADPRDVAFASSIEYSGAVRIEIRRADTQRVVASATIRGSVGGLLSTGGP